VQKNYRYKEGEDSMSGVIVIGRDESKKITRAEKLEYLSSRLNDNELHAFMNLANEFKLYTPCKDDIEDFFDLLQCFMVAFFKFNRDTDWTYCPLEKDDDDEK